MKTIQDPQRIKQVGKFYDKLKESHYDYFDYWLHHTLFHWDFFLSLFLTFFPWIVWIKVKKRDSTSRLLFVGFFVGLFSIVFDFWGTMYGLWYYTGKILPTMPSFNPWDSSILPVMVMLLLQTKPKISPFLKGLFFACVSSFIGEPLFQWIGLYIIVKWSVFYSFPIYFLLYLVSHKLSKAENFAFL